MQEHIISRRYAMFGKQYTIDGRMFEEFPHSMMLYRASRIIDEGLNGNCLDYAILNAAAIESVGGRTRVTIAQNALGEGHAYAEVFLTNNTTELESIENYLAMKYPVTTMHYLSVHSQGNGEYWMSLDWQANYPGASFFHDNGEFCSYYPSGYYSCHKD